MLMVLIPLLVGEAFFYVQCYCVMFYDAPLMYLYVSFIGICVFADHSGSYCYYDGGSAAYYCEKDCE